MMFEILFKITSPHCDMTKTVLIMVILFIFSYKVVVGLVDPVGNTVELHDLKPYTYYQLDLRDRNGQKLYASVNFSTAGQKLMLKNLTVRVLC